MARPARTPLVPGSPEWHAWRRTGVGSSDIPIITGDAPWRDADVVSLYQEKLGYTPARVASASMEAGQWLEDIIARWWADKTSRKVRRINAGLRSRDMSWAIASPDRAVAGGGLLEVKIADHPGDAWGKPESDQIPDHYFEQVQWQAFVADVEVVDVAVFFTRSRQRVPYRVGRDMGVIDELLEYGAAFWRCVQERTAPQPPTARVNLPLREDEIEADEELELLTVQLIEAEQDLAGRQSVVDELKSAIRERLSDVGGARGPGFRIHYRPQADRTITNWQAAAQAYRDLIEEYGLDVDFATFQRVLPKGLDGVLADLTSTKPGARPLLVKRTKEGTRASA